MTTINNETHFIPYPPKWRLYLMRVLYALTFISLAFDYIPVIFFPTELNDTLTGVAYSFWASYGLLMGLGIRYPLQMLPLIFLQLLYKAAWLAGTYYPNVINGQLNDDLEAFYWICIWAVVIDIIVIPWGYVWKRYLSTFLDLKKSGSL